MPIETYLSQGIPFSGSVGSPLQMEVDLIQFLFIAIAPFS